MIVAEFAAMERFAPVVGSEPIVGLESRFVETVSRKIGKESMVRSGDLELEFGFGN